MGIKSLGNKKSISYAAVWEETGTGAWLPESWYGGTGKWYGARGIVAGGRDGSNGAQKNNINYLNITNQGTASDFGDLLSARYQFKGCSNGIRGVMAAGQPSNTNVIQYITTATTGNATSFGTLTGGRRDPASVSDGKRGFWCGMGVVIDYVEIATTGNAVEFGELTEATQAAGGVNSATRACICGGWTSGQTNKIDYFNMRIPGNAADFGDLTYSKYGLGGSSSDNGYGVVFGGDGASTSRNQINIGTLGNASSIGNLHSGRDHNGGCSNGTTGWTAGGSYQSGGGTNSSEYWNIKTGGSSSNGGDILYGTSACAAVAGSES